MSYLEKYLAKNPRHVKNKAGIAYLAGLDYLHQHSPKIARSIVGELEKQRSQLKLIASENYSSYAVQLAMGNWMTDKYAEGFVGHRFYAGCENVDICEQEAIDQLKSIFGCDHAYVQSHCGADANLLAIWSALVHQVESKEIEKLGKKKVEDLSAEEYETIRQLMVNSKMMGMSLDAGGHLTHGYRRNISSKMLRASTYGIDPKTEEINYSQFALEVEKIKPTILIAGYSAYSRRLNFAKIKEIASRVGAILIVDMAHFSGLVAGKVFKGEHNPIPYADFITSTTHKTLRGPRGGLVMCNKKFAETVDRGCPLVMGGPLPHVMAAKAVAFQEANTQSFQSYAHQIVENARALAQFFIDQGYHILSRGTDNHMLILDVSDFEISGRQAEDALLKCGICLNRNTILNDQNGPWYTSGVRIGTAAITTLGMKEAEMKELGQIILEVLQNTKAARVPSRNVFSKAKFILDSTVEEKSSKRIKELLDSHPLYPEVILSS